jgi:hypothetical protein
MALEDYLPKPVDPNAPKVLDLALCRQLIARAPRFSMQPAGDTIREFAEQLQLAMNEIGGTSTKIVTAQNEATRYQREAETANNETRVANQALILAREELAKMKAKVAPVAVVSVDSAPSVEKVPKKRGPKAKVVPMQTEPAKVAK